jgi:hypothetical protein
MPKRDPDPKLVRFAARQARAERVARGWADDDVAGDTFERDRTRGPVGQAERQADPRPRPRLAVLENVRGFGARE